MQSMIHTYVAASMIAAVGLGVAAGQDTRPTSRPALDPKVDEILMQVERQKVHDLQAEITWTLRHEIDDEDEQTVKSGMLWYAQADPVAKFKVHFRHRVGRVRRPMDEQYLFDGRWYVELDANTKFVTRREVRQADDTSDPYKLGEGPFPVPFGQTKSDILNEFDVKLAPPSDDDPENTDHLVLTPHVGTQTHKRYATMHFWVAREGRLHGLPLKVKTSKKAGTGRIDAHITVTFDDVKLNKGVPADTFEIKTPRGFEEIIEPLRIIEPSSPGDVETP